MDDFSELEDLFNFSYRTPVSRQQQPGSSNMMHFPWSADKLREAARSINEDRPKLRVLATSSEVGHQEAPIFWDVSLVWCRYIATAVSADFMKWTLQIVHAGTVVAAGKWPPWMRSFASVATIVMHTSVCCCCITWWCAGDSPTAGGSTLLAW